MFNAKLAIQYHVCQLCCGSRNAKIQTIEKLRHALTPLLNQLALLQCAAIGTTAVRQNQQATKLATIQTDNEEMLTYWDDLDDAVDEQLISKNISGTLAPENVKIGLPSNGNISPVYKATELVHQKQQAQNQLQQIQSLIADKSFQYTEHIWGAPRKCVCTWARTTIMEKERDLSFVCQVYTWC